MQSRLRHNTTFYGWAAGSGIMFVLLGVGWIIGAQYLPEADFSLVMLGVLTCFWVQRQFSLCCIIAISSWHPGCM